MATEVRKIGPPGPYDNNAYVIVDTASQQSIFVDAPFESERALEVAKDTKVQQIVVTHRHGDHWANIDLVKEKLAVPVMCHEADKAPYERKVDATVGDGDDGNTADGDGCDSNCKPTACGNGVRAGGELHPDLVWTYRDPIAAVREIAGRVCFYDEKVDLTVV